MNLEKNHAEWNEPGPKRLIGLCICLFVGNSCEVNNNQAKICRITEVR